MRHLTIAFALLVACAPDADPDPSQATVPDAGTDLCPLARAEGYAGAMWFADTGCVYQCRAATHQRCGDVWAGGRPTSYGVCTPLNDRRNCGLCGVVCETREDCVRPPGSAQFYCLARLR